jgi:hypothetical protein
MRLIKKETWNLMADQQRRCVLCGETHLDSESQCLYASRYNILQKHLSGHLTVRSYGGCECLARVGLLDDPKGLAYLQYVNVRLRGMLQTRVQEIIELLPKPLQTDPHLHRTVWRRICTCGLIPNMATDEATAGARTVVEQIMLQEYGIHIPRSNATETDSTGDAKSTGRKRKTTDTYPEDMLGELRSENKQLREQVKALRIENETLWTMLGVREAAMRPRLTGPIVPPTEAAATDDMYMDVEQNDAESVAPSVNDTPPPPLPNDASVDGDEQEQEQGPDEYDEEIEALRTVADDIDTGGRDQHRAQRAASKAFADDRLEHYRSLGVALIDIKPVYLGHCSAYANLREPVTRDSLRARIVRDFGNMTPEKFAKHPLREYFEPAGALQGRSGYVPRRFVSPRSGRTRDVMQIDHILPAYWDQRDVGTAPTSRRSRRPGSPAELLRDARLHERVFRLPDA